VAQNRFILFMKNRGIKLLLKKWRRPATSRTTAGVIWGIKIARSDAENGPQKSTGQHHE